MPTSRMPHQNKSERLTRVAIPAFQKKIYGYYHKDARKLPWRKDLNPYRVLVSEIMLQQTQVERVIVKYKEFLAAFPDFSSLAKASLPKLLKIWLLLMPPGKGSVKRYCPGVIY